MEVVVVTFKSTAVRLDDQKRAGDWRREGWVMGDVWWWQESFNSNNPKKRQEFS
jgi:hypothetical protein